MKAQANTNHLGLKKKKKRYIKANKSQWNIKNIYCRVPAKYVLTQQKKSTKINRYFKCFDSLKLFVVRYTVTVCVCV